MQVMTVQRWPELDGLRGLAILLVVVAHANLIAAAAGGMVGVTLFFVLSGFLITHLLIQERDESGRIDLRAFYARRAMRLLPALFVYLVGFTLIASLLGLGFPVWETISATGSVRRELLATVWDGPVGSPPYVEPGCGRAFLPDMAGPGGARRREEATPSWGSCRIADALAIGHRRHRSNMGLPRHRYQCVRAGIGCLVAVLYQRGSRLSLPSWSAALGVSFLVLLSLLPYRSMDDLYRIGVWMPILAALCLCSARLGLGRREKVVPQRQELALVRRHLVRPLPLRTRQYSCCQD